MLVCSLTAGRAGLKYQPADPVEAYRHLSWDVLLQYSNNSGAGWVTIGTASAGADNVTQTYN